MWIEEGLLRMSDTPSTAEAPCFRRPVTQPPYSSHLELGAANVYGLVGDIHNMFIVLKTTG